MKNVLYISLMLVTLMFWRDWSSREIIHEPGILVPEQPQQRSPGAAETIAIGDYRLTPRAEFDLRARVLSRENYRWGSQSDLSPMDLALGWGVMSDQQVLDRITISQGTRWYFTRYEYPAPIADNLIITNSSNMHMVPANDWVLKKLRKVRHGNIVNLKGFLVDVKTDAGFTWTTSLRRDDTGNGACEIFYVVHINIEEH